MTTFVPKYFTRKAIILYVVLLILCSVALINKVLPLHWVAFGLVEVISFFYFSNLLTKKWGPLTRQPTRPNFFARHWSCGWRT